MSTACSCVAANTTWVLRRAFPRVGEPTLGGAEEECLPANASFTVHFLHLGPRHVHAEVKPHSVRKGFISRVLVSEVLRDSCLAFLVSITTFQLRHSLYLPPSTYRKNKTKCPCVDWHRGRHRSLPIVQHDACCTIVWLSVVMLLFFICHFWSAHLQRFNF